MWLKPVRGLLCAHLSGVHFYGSFPVTASDACRAAPIMNILEPDPIWRGRNLLGVALHLLVPAAAAAALLLSHDLTMRKQLGSNRAESRQVLLHVGQRHVSDGAC